MTKRHRRAHRRRAVQSARDARKRTGRKLLDMRNRASLPEFERKYPDPMEMINRMLGSLVVGESPR